MVMELHDMFSSHKCGLITNETKRNDLKRILSQLTEKKLLTLITTLTAVACIDSSHVDIVIFYWLPYSLMYIQQGVYF